MNTTFDAFVFALSFLAVLIVYNFAPNLGLLDEPNHRSLHQKIKARGGGLGIIFAFLFGILLDQENTMKYWWPALIVGVLGFLDDRQGLKARTRFLGHLAAAVGFYFAIGGLPSINIFGFFDWTGLGVAFFAIGFIIWFVNLYNFMDGSDGIAASQVILVSLGSIALRLLTREQNPNPSESLLFSSFGILAASTAGFLILNWQPSKIFMGDAGSGFLGFILAGMALQCEKQHLISGGVSLILNSTFICDTTLTLCRRLLNKKKFFEAHRSHAYQKAILSGWSHQKVALVNVAFFTLCIFPLAYLAQALPVYSWISFVVTYTLVAAFWIKMKGGRD